MKGLLKIGKHTKLMMLVSLIFLCFNKKSIAQCFPNVDFESGTFQGWNLYTGSVAAVNNTNIISLNPIAQLSDAPQSFQIISSAFDPTDDKLDFYGNFPKYSPNGSAYSIRLGNEQTGSRAEGISFDFVVPTNQFSLTYYYAVVFEDPGHASFAQPRLEIEVKNVTDNTSAGCSSFSFIASGGLPGFFESSKTRPGSNGTPILCRNWSASTINLDGNIGKTFRIFFKTADCTIGGHFGYAYLDIASQCGTSFVGASYCPTDTVVNVVAPPGYESYRWFNQGFTQVLGIQDTLRLSPAPASGTSFLVEVTPYAGYGCIDTLTATLVDNLVVTADAGPDKTPCNNTVVQIGKAPLPGLVYKWTPTTGLSNPNIANPTATPSTADVIYTLTVSSLGGGCGTTDQVTVFKPTISNAITLIGTNTFCTNTGQSAVLQVGIADSIQWYKDNVAIIGAIQPNYNVTASGNYKASLFSISGGCNVTTASKRVDVYPSPNASFTVNNTTQCFPQHSFVCTNASTITFGNIQYTWSLGDNAIKNTQDVTYSYATTGNYAIKLTAEAAGGCADDTTINVIVKPGAAADFTVQPVCINILLPLVNKTTATGASVINYLWEFGNNDVSASPLPVYAYTQAGSYSIKLSASTVECPQPTTKEVVVNIDAPIPALRYTDQTAIINFPELLKSRTIGNTAKWNPPTNLSNINIYNPMFRGAIDQLYNITLKTLSGCITVDTLLVKVVKKIKINVPTVFSPNADGKNDFLKPLLFGFKKINYFKIYNRWGTLVFETKNEQPGWDGKVNGIPQDTQTYIWMIEAEDVDGFIHQEKGTTSIVK